jgi:hypothetical protein
VSTRQFMSDSGVFFLHEDEWGMIDLLPVENFDASAHIAQEAEEFGKAHFDGFGWTDLYVIPAPKVQLAVRNIPLAEVRAMASDYLPEAEHVETGIQPGEIHSEHGFAFGDTSKGFLYGEQAEGIVQYLCFVPPEREDDESARFWAAAFMALGTSYRLMLADWWQKKLVDLSDSDAVARYLRPTP